MRPAVSLVLGASLLAAAGSLHADVIESDSQLMKFSESVMASVARGDLDGAFAVMKPYVVIPDAEFQALIVNTRAQRGLTATRYGKTVGSECVTQKKAGQSVVRITCVEKTEKHALPWTFYFYRSPRGWMLNSFVWNDNLPSLFSQ